LKVWLGRGSGTGEWKTENLLQAVYGGF